MKDGKSSQNDLFSIFKRMPKVELHRHLEGSLRPELLSRLAARNGIDLPFRSPSEFYNLLQFD